jgi:hypothetical protein
MPRIYLATLIVSLVAITGAAVGQVANRASEDPAYWANRMENALLPQAALRAKVTLRSSNPTHPIHGFSGRLVRVQNAAGIRSILSIEKPAEARRILRVESRPAGQAQRVLYTRFGDPIALKVPHSERILRTSLTYEDVAFVPLGHRGVSMEFEAAAGDKVVRLTSGPYDGYGKVVTRVDRELGLPIDAEFFDRAGKLRRRVTYGEIETVGPYSFPLEIKATDLETSFVTTIRLSAVELGAEIYEHEFTDDYNLKLIRIIE